MSTRRERGLVRWCGGLVGWGTALLQPNKEVRVWLFLTSFFLDRLEELLLPRARMGYGIVFGRWGLVELNKRPRRSLPGNGTIGTILPVTCRTGVADLMTSVQAVREAVISPPASGEENLSHQIIQTTEAREADVIDLAPPSSRTSSDVDTDSSNESQAPTSPVTPIESGMADHVILDINRFQSPLGMGCDTDQSTPSGRTSSHDGSDSYNESQNFQAPTSHDGTADHVILDINRFQSPPETNAKKLQILSDAEKEGLEKIFQPKHVSIGPYHSQKKELQTEKSQDIKDRFHQLKLQEVIVREDRKAKGFYKVDTEFPPNFTESLFFDAFFIIDFLVKWKEGECSSDLCDGMKNDLLLLENQIPLFIVVIVHGWVANETTVRSIPSLKQLIREFWSDSISALYITSEEINKANHLLELFYRVYTMEWEASKNSGIGVSHGPADSYDFPCASELKKSGLEFYVKKQGTNNLLDITYKRGKLEVPYLSMDERFITRLANLVQYEKHVKKSLVHSDGWDVASAFYLHKKPVTSLLYFLGYLIQDKADVQILRDARIKKNDCGIDKKLPEILNNMKKSTTLDYKSNQLSGILNSLQEQLSSNKNKWVSEFKEEYLRGSISTIKLFKEVASLVILGGAIVHFKH